MITGLMATYALLLPTAAAFCGVYVGSAEDSPTNERSRAILANGDWYSADEAYASTLTLATDVQTELSEFALVIPVPEGFGEDQVGTVSAELVDQVFAYADPRLVSYSCELEVLEERSIRGADTPDFSLGCNEYSLMEEDKFESFDAGDDGIGIGSADDIDASGVTVESSFSEAEYELVVLSAEDGDGLLGWLRDEGFTMPPATRDVLEDLVDEGSWFLAARVSLDAVPEGRSWLSPLQLRYTERTSVLPIRIGTAAAEGPQEVQLVVLEDGGSAAISNYPEVEVESECMPSAELDFSDHFAETVADAVDEAGGAGWFVEYAWPIAQKCDPCTSSDPFDAEELAQLGISYPQDLWLTRLRVRYEPALADEDLVIYNTGITEAAQLRYIQYAHELEYRYPLCGEGWAEDPGECPDPGEPAVGCSVSARPALTGMVFALTLLWRRREGRA